MNGEKQHHLEKLQPLFTDYNVLSVPNVGMCEGHGNMSVTLA